jgi:hypothetical protein
MSFWNKGKVTESGGSGSSLGLRGLAAELDRTPPAAAPSPRASAPVDVDDKSVSAAKSAVSGPAPKVNPSAPLKDRIYNDLPSVLGLPEGAPLGHLASRIFEDPSGRTLAFAAGQIACKPQDLRKKLSELLWDEWPATRFDMRSSTIPSSYLKSRIDSGLGMADVAKAYGVNTGFLQQMVNAAKQQSQQPPSSSGGGSSDPWGVLPTNPSAGKDGTGKADKSEKLSAYDTLMKREGMEEFQEYVKGVLATIRVNRERRAENLPAEPVNMNALLEGNAGTGKTTGARLLGEILKEEGALEKGHLVEVGGADLVEGGVALLQKKLKEAEGGVFLIDEIYQLDPKRNPKAREVVDALLKALEDNRDKIAFIGTGYTEENDQFLKYNQGLPSRFAERIGFRDHSNELLRKTFDNLLKERGYEVDPDVADRAIRRLGKARGPGFGNARAVRNAVELSIRRQALRLEEQGKTKDKAALQKLERDDVLGPKIVPGRKYKAMEKIEKMVGIPRAKQELRDLIALIEMNAVREEAGEDVLWPILNARLDGDPGTGKSTFGRYYLELLQEMGLISGARLKEFGREDLVDTAVGGTAGKTKDALDSVRGGGGLIDEAYALYKKTDGDFGAEAIDTIVKNVSATPGDDRVVLMAGYTNKMEEMFRKANPGLSRRFPIVFHFDTFDDEALKEVLIQKVEGRGLKIDQAGIDAALSELGRQRMLQNFGNAGSVDNLVDKAVKRQSTRLAKGGGDRKQLGAEDFKIGPQPQPEKALDPLDQVPGSDPLKEKMRELSVFVRRKLARGRQVLGTQSVNMAFMGPSGTTEKAAAQKMGEVLFNLHLAGSSEVSVKKPADLIAEFVGQTAPKTLDVLESSLGKTLVIRDAGSIMNSSFGKDAIDEIVSFLEDYRGRSNLILLDSPESMERLFANYPRLGELFIDRVGFSDLQAEDASKVFLSALETYELTLRPDVKDALPKILSNLTQNIGALSPTQVAQLAHRTALKQGVRCEAENDFADETVKLEDLMEAVREVVRAKSPGTAAMMPESEPNPNQPVATKAADANVHAQRFETRKRVKEQTTGPTGVDGDGEGKGLDRDLVLKQLHDIIDKDKIPPDEVRSMMSGGKISQKVLTKLAQKLGLDVDEMEIKLKDLLKDLRKEVEERGRDLSDQEIDQLQSMWVCQYCGNSNPNCPYKAEKIGGYFVPLNQAPS